MINNQFVFSVCSFLIILYLLIIWFMNTTQTDVMALFVQNFLFRQNMMQIQIDQLTYQNINCLRCFNGGRLGLILISSDWLK